MSAPAVVIVPTAGRPGYLEAALASVMPQARAARADVLVVDDGPSDSTRTAAAAAGARYVAHTSCRGLNAARNTGVENSTAPLICFIDDDVTVHGGWLQALLDAAETQPEDVAVLTGPILAKFSLPRRVCGREQPPITHLDLGDRTQEVDYAWGANLAIRRSALRSAGPFDESLGLYGDEQEWQDRVKAAGGRVVYVGEAALDHHRNGEDATPRALRRAAYSRGRASRRYDRLKGRSPSLTTELRVLGGSALHGPRYRCANGPVMAAHSAGRLCEALSERFGGSAPAATAGVDDFLSGRSGIATGRAAAVLRAADLADDVRALPARARRQRAAASMPARDVLVLATERTDVASVLDQALAEIKRSRHRVDVRRMPVTIGRGKFDHLNDLLAGAGSLSAYDWVLVLDDDVALPARFLDTFLAAAEAGRLELAQPAHRRHSHAAWPVTVRRSGDDWRETSFVEIGPLTAFSRTAAAALLPFPSEIGMGWGLDAHWSALAAQNGWRIGVVDATPVGHTLRVPARDYARRGAADDAREFLKDRPYTPRDQVRTIEAGRLP